MFLNIYYAVLAILVIFVGMNNLGIYRGKANMNVDKIYEIMEKYDKLPYKCILFNGDWGIGKSYAIRQFVGKKGNFNIVSVYGLHSPSELYREILYNATGFNSEYVEILFSGLKWLGKQIKELLFLVNIGNMSINHKFVLDRYINRLTKDYYIIIDDLERINDNVELKEILGIINYLKNKSHIKIVLIANLKELFQDSNKKEIYISYSEKIIDNTYNLNEISKHINWKNINVDEAFIKTFLKKHEVRNLRTIEKAQNLYDDIFLAIGQKYSDDFCNTVKLTCYGVVSEYIEKIYLKEKPAQDASDVDKIIWESENSLGHRILFNYIDRPNVTIQFIEKIIDYYKNTIEISPQDWDYEYNIFNNHISVDNYYKSDEEIKREISCLKTKLYNEKSINDFVKIANEYFRWSNILKISIEADVEYYSEKFCSLLFEILILSNTLDSDLFRYSQQLELDYVKEINKKVYESVKKELVMFWVNELSKNTCSEISYKYSNCLRMHIDDWYTEDIGKLVDKLYDVNSFPIDNVNQYKYETSRNIIIVLYSDNKHKLKEYVNELNEKCDYMARHRIHELMAYVEKHYD